MIVPMRHLTLLCVASEGEKALESLRAESRELLLMVGKSINTASGRMQGKTIGA